MIHDFEKIDYKNRKYKSSKFEFDNSKEMLEYVKNAPINSMFDESNLASKKYDPHFHDFDTFEDALDALEYGTKIYFENFKKDFKIVKDYISKISKNKNGSYKNDVIGFIPIVPNVLRNYPINMINQDKKPKKIPTAKFVIDKTCNSNTNSVDMCSFYSIIFALVQYLENKGTRCEIYVVEASVEDDEIMVESLKLKNYMQPLNVYKIQFPIISTDYFRRILFRMVETNPDIRHNVWRYGYGSPLISHFDIGFSAETNPLATKIFGLEKDDIFIPSCQIFHYHKGDSLSSTIYDIVNNTNLKKYINVSKK